jgi:hypothetical protein
MNDSRHSVIQYRRCHICGHVNQSTPKHLHDVQCCESCHKHFAPFYYFDDRGKPTVADFTLRPPHLEGEWSPIQGLTAYWEST